METKSVQEGYPGELSHCFGCGRVNEHGHQLKSYWDGKEAVAHHTPLPEHIAIPGFVYGGLIASLIDCHGIATAAAATAEDPSKPERFVTASLKVDYQRPTPIGVALELRARPKEIHARKVVVEVQLLARGEACARGEVIAVRLPESMMPAGAGRGS
jgi:acyl-coenzyme A thioesterase PaaI-like protein